MVLSPDEDANLHMNWIPGDPITHINVLAGVSSGAMTGGFIALAVGPEIELKGIRLEDGFGFFLPTRIWAASFDALLEGRNVDLLDPGPDQLGLAVRFLPDQNI
jgi:hypothetical protein